MHTSLDTDYAHFVNLPQVGLPLEYENLNV